MSGPGEAGISGVSLLFGPAPDVGGLPPSAVGVPVGRWALRLLGAFVFVVAGRVNEIEILHGIPLGKIFAVFALILLAREWAPAGVPKPAVVREERLVLWLYALCVASVPLSVWPRLSLQTVTTSLPYHLVLLFLASRITRSWEALEKVLTAWVLSVAFLAVQGLVVGVSHLKGVGFSYDANDLALTLLCAVPFCLLFVRARSGGQRLFFGAALVAIAIVFVMTVSRGGFIGLVGMLGYMLLGAGRGQRSRWIGVGLAGLLGLVVLAPDAYWERMSTIWHPTTEYDATAGGRMMLWSEAARLALTNPLLGTGVGNLSNAMGQSSAVWKTAHNSYLQVAAELGLGGLALYLALTLGTLRYLRELRKRCEGAWPRLVRCVFALECSLVAYLVCGLALSQAFFAYFYLFLGLVAALRRLVPEQTLARSAVAPGGFAAQRLEPRLGEAAKGRIR